VSKILPTDLLIIYRQILYNTFISFLILDSTLYIGHVNNIITTLEKCPRSLCFTAVAAFVCGLTPVRNQDVSY
jgi:hypothetical protein